MQRNRSLSAVVLVAFTAILLPAMARAVPTQLNVQGVLFDETGAAVEGAAAVTVRLYEAADPAVAPMALWEPAVALDVLCEAGVFTALVPAMADGAEAEAFEAAFDAGEPRWLGIAPGGGAELTPRIPVVSVAYALVAGKAARADLAEAADVAHSVDCVGCIAADALDPAVQAAFLAYDNGASGLDATTYQAAVDELAGLVDALRTDLAALQAGVDGLAAVARSGAYGDLSGTPDLSAYAETSDLAAVATSGAYGDLSGTPDLSGYAQTADLAAVATTGSYGDLTGTPTLAAVATTGAYGDLSGTPDLSVYAETSELAPVATSGQFDALLDIPEGLADGDNDTLGGLACAPGQVARRDATGWVCGPGGGDLPHVPRATTSTAVDPTTPAREYTSITVGVDGLPIIAHYRESGTGAGLRVVHCGNPACSAGNTVTLVDPGADRGRWSSIAIDREGRPIVAYFNWGATPVELKVARCANTDCSGTADVRVVDTGSGDYASLAIGRDGLPIIAYQRQDGNYVLKVTKCLSPNCDQKSTFTVDGDDRAGIYSNLAIGGDGLPIVAHFVGASAALRVAHCGSVDCASDVQRTTVQSSEFVGVALAMAIGLDGLPVIAYVDGHQGPNNRLWVTKCGNALCSSFPSTTQVDATSYANDLMSMTIDPVGLPTIAYITHPAGTPTDRSLMLAKCGNSGCSALNTLRAIDRPVRQSNIPSITMGADGLPVIAYWAGADAAPVLRVAKCANPFCLPYWSRR